ncbi:MAG: TOPRIM nucleotidyl transferase/hydrolase domain-containing protein, partial [Gaiellaceae bacterium]
MAVILVEGITDQIALEAAARRLGRDLVAEGVEIVPLGGAQAVARAAADHAGVRLAGMCDAGEESYFRRALGEAVFVCREDLEDELIRALGPERVEAVLAEQGDLETFRNFQNQPAWRGRPVDAQLRRWFHAADRRAKRYP